MDFNRELWADAYKFYTLYLQMMERSRDDLAAFFSKLAQEINIRSAQATPEGRQMWAAVYNMLEWRSKVL